MKGEIESLISKSKRKKKIIKIAQLLLLIFLLLLLILYIVLGIIYNSGSFTITLDRNLHFERGIIIYDDPNYKVFRTELYAEVVEHLDNICYKWLPNDLHDHEGGSHNGDNYIAYTFYVENIGVDVVNYWTELYIVDVVKHIDDAIRIRVYKDDEEYKTYAKLSKRGEPEPHTVPFEYDERVFIRQIKDFKPGDINKYTVVIWIEGTDPECTDNILGGSIKIQQDFNAEILEKEI